MDELIQTFHIDWKLLIAQIINFGIVLGVLWWFAIKPLMRIMKKRSGDIEQSLKDAEEIEKKLQAAEEKKDAILTEAKKQAQVIVDDSNKQAEKIKEDKLKQTREEMEKIAAKTKASLASEKEKMVSEAKAEVADLIVQASSKVVGENLDAERNKKIIVETVNQVKQ